MQRLKQIIFVVVSLFGLFLIANNFDYVGAGAAILFALGIFTTRSSSILYRKYLYVLIFLVTGALCFFHYQIILSACPDRNVVHYGQIPNPPCIEGPEGVELYGVNLNLAYLLTVINVLSMSVAIALALGLITGIVHRKENEGFKFLGVAIQAFAIIFSILTVLTQVLVGLFSQSTLLTHMFVTRGRAPIISTKAEQTNVPVVTRPTRDAIYYLSTPNPLDMAVEGYDIDRDAYPRDVLSDEYPSKVFELKDVIVHNSTTDCWIINNSRVYNVTGLLSHADVHSSILKLQGLCGTDITATVNTSPVEPGSLNTARVRYALSTLVIGRLSDVNVTNKIKTYINQTHGYSISYPQDWILEPETQVLMKPNRLLSIVNFTTQDKSKKVSIIVNEKEWMMRLEALKKESITINGTEQSAYIFPKGYEGCDSNAEDCSFFVIPVRKENVWYELRANGDAQTVTDTYKEIFSSFKFTK